MKILFVDDDNTLGSVVSLLLQHNGHNVDYASSLEEAKELMARNNWDLIILDWLLTDGSGVELCKSYRELGGLSPVLMLTGKSSLDDKEFALEFGADDYLTKPFEPRELTARVKSLLRRSTQYSPKATLRDLVPGAIVNEKYRLFNQIGEGGMATIWLANDLTNNIDVVVKIVHGHLLGTPEILKRFEQEWQLLSRIKHPNIVKFLDAGTFKSGTPYLVMEYVEGQTLQHTMSENSNLELEFVLQCMIQVCKGVQAIHDLAMIHRDLKPENIIFKEDENGLENIKIVDFGLTRLMELGERFTRDDLVIGTVEYLSPEQLLNRTIDARSDIFALGILFFELLTGTTPFNGGKPEAVMAQHLSGEPSLPSKLRAELGKNVDDIVQRALRKAPSERYQSAKEMQNAFENLLEKTTPDRNNFIPSLQKNKQKIVEAQLAEIAEEFMNNLPSILDELEKCLIALKEDLSNKSKLKEARILAHKLSGSSGDNEIKEIGKCFKIIESLLSLLNQENKDNSFSDIDKQIAVLRKQITFK